MLFCKVIQMISFQPHTFQCLWHTGRFATVHISSSYSNSSTLATWCKQLTHWKRPRCWEGLRSGGEGEDRGRDGWIASLTRWTWVWVSSGCWELVMDWEAWLTAIHRVAESGTRWATELTELNWTDSISYLNFIEFARSEIHSFSYTDLWIFTNA